MATYGGKTADGSDGQEKITETAAEYVKRMMAEAQQVRPPPRVLSSLTLHSL